MSGGTPNYVFTLGPELLKKANKELNEKEKHRKRDIQVLRERVLANKGKSFSHTQASENSWRTMQHPPPYVKYRQTLSGMGVVVTLSFNAKMDLADFQYNLKD